ncbi:MAG: hypothetical protein JWO10_1810 [Microbacteriaceae bacterium]|nr:hypothetical protein [Microbacteriaceae bacterium]
MSSIIVTSVFAAVAASGIIGTIVVTLRDGYRPVPKRTTFR